MKESTKKNGDYKCELITFDEFIDCLTENRGEELKKRIRTIELNSSLKKNEKLIRR